MKPVVNLRGILPVLLAGVLGAGVFFLLYSELLPPGNVGWIVKTGTDPFQHYIGWELYRDSPWSWPLGRIEHIGYPTGIPLTFTDSIPLFSMAFKLFSGFLPFPFQFDGIWMLLCFVLQGVFGCLLLQRFFEKKYLAVLGSLFFILSPIMMFRLGGHSALGAHWLILWSLLLVLKNEGSIRVVQWTAVLALSVLIHPYFLFICGPLFAADACRRVFVLRALTFWRGALLFLAEAVFIAFISYAIGVFGGGSATGSGYGVFSLDLNALINPYGWSTTNKNIKVREPNEGFNYLGLGIIFLLALSAYELLRADTRPDRRALWRQWWPLISVCFILTAVAVTNTVSFFGRELFHLPLPAFLQDKIFGVVRSSGRLFWPVYYLIVLGSFFVLRRVKHSLAIGLLIFALCVQVYDMKDKLMELNHFFDIAWENPLRDSFWAGAGQAYEHTSFIPKFVPGRYEPIAYFAAQYDMTLNTGYVVRAAGRVNETPMKAQIEALGRGEIDTTTLYIFSEMKEAERLKLKDKVRTIDGYILLAP